MNETSRIAFSPKFIEIDASTGDLLMEVGALIIILSTLYIGKKLVDEFFKKE